MRIFFFVIALLIAQSVFTQEFKTETSLDTSFIRIGEQTTFRITASGVDNPEAIKWPEIKDTLHRNIEVIEALPIDTLKSEMPLTLEQAVVITSWDSGYYAIRPYDLEYGGTNFKTEALLLSVNTVPVDTTAAPMDIKPIYLEPFSLKDWLKLNWPYLLALLIAIILVVIILQMKRKGSVDVFGPAPVRVIPAHEKALTRLKVLQESEAFSQAKKKRYYSELTETLRAYLEERYKVKALEQTSAEIIEGIRYLGLKNDEVDYLRSLLYTGDMVKFAKEQPSNIVAQNHLERAFEFIQGTKIEEQEEEPVETQIPSDE